MFAGLEGQPSYLGIVTRVAMRYWWRLPRHVMVYVDPEDLVQAVLVRLVRAAPCYNPEAARPTTFIWTVAQNECRVVINHYLQQKRTATGVYSIDDCAEVETMPAPDRQGCGFRERRQAFEDLLRCASDDLRLALAVFLRERRYRPWPPPLLNELRTLLDRQRMGCEDLRLLLGGI